MGIDLAQWRASIGRFYRFRMKGIQSGTARLCFLRIVLGILIIFLRFFSSLVDTGLFFIVNLLLITFKIIIHFLGKITTRDFLSSVW